MTGKDHYSTLQLSPTATEQEIRKAYRRLAHEFHPDKTNNNPLSATRFAEIKEAYEVLGNISKRQDYHYKRFYNKYTEAPVITSRFVLQQSIELRKLTEALGRHIDFDLLLFQVKQIFSRQAIYVLQKENDMIVTRNIIDEI